MASKPKDPLVMAQTFRIMFEHRLPQRPTGKSEISAYEFALMVQQQTKGTFEEAMNAVQQVIPEVFADYWLERIRADMAKG